MQSCHHPDYRAISNFRKNYLNALPGLFEQIIDITMKLDYISLGHVSINGSKIKAALKELEEHKPEAESKTPEKDQINFTDTESRIHGYENSRRHSGL